MGINICTILFLGFNSWKDIRSGEISLWTVGISALIGLGNGIIKGRMDLWAFLPVGIGIGLLAVSIATGGSLGMGDCWIVAALGLLLEPENFFVTLGAALCLACVCAAVLLAVFKKSRKFAFPFVPFLLAGYLGGLCL